MKKPKKSVSFRLSEDVIKKLTNLSNSHKISQSDVIAVLVHFASTGGDEDDLERMFEMAQQLG